VPNPSTPRPVGTVTRRAAVTGLAVGGSALWAGCTNDDDRRPRARRRREAQKAVAADPDIAVAAEALAGERAVLDAVTATSTRHPDLAAALTPVMAAHEAHVTLLAAAAPDENPSASATAGPSDVPPFRVPAKVAAAVRRLAMLELELSTEAKRHAFAAESGAFARLLASMAASAAQQAVGLEAGS
jgi:hypothetical protein